MANNPTVSITFLGWIPNVENKTTITGSAHVVNYQAMVKKVEHQIKVLFDMGSFGDNKISIVDELQMQWLGDLQELDAVIISHVHNDHIGNLLTLIRKGYRGLVYMSHTSKAILIPILEDIIELAGEPYRITQARNIKFGILANKMLSKVEQYNKKSTQKSHDKHAKQKDKKQCTEQEYQKAKEFLEEYNITQNSDIAKRYLPLPEVPFDKTDMRQLLTQLRSLDKEKDHLIAHKEWLKLKTKFYEAGHVEGAVQTVLKFGYDPYHAQHQHQLLYTWDLWRIKEPVIVPEPDRVQEKVNQTIIESTYGNRVHNSRKPDQERLIENLNTATDFYMIPAFSLGRSLEVLQQMTDSIDNGTLVLWEEEKIFMDGKLTKDIADRLLERYPEKYAFLNHPSIAYIEWKDDRKTIYEQEGRTIVIASGGMMQGGSSISFANKYMSDKNAQIATVWYQAFGTWGNYLQNNKGFVYTFDRFKQMKNKLYHPDHTLEKIKNRELGESVLISWQGTRELQHILLDLYEQRSVLNLGENEYIYVPDRFWYDEEKKNSTLQKSKSFLKRYDSDTYGYFLNNIRITKEDDDYDEDKKYIAPWPGIHIFWDSVGKKYLKAKMDHYSSYSWHADRDELLSVLEDNKQAKQHTTILVHGEPEARKEFAEHIAKNRKIPAKTILPELYETLLFDCITGALLEHKKQE